MTINNTATKKPRKRGPNKKKKSAVKPQVIATVINSWQTVPSVVDNNMTTAVEKLLTDMTAGKLPIKTNEEAIALIYTTFLKNSPPHVIEPPTPIEMEDQLWA